MQNNEQKIFNNWKEFVIGQPDEIIMNHLDIIKNHTAINGDLKHKNEREIIKVFSIFITHNYGTYIYELCNFLKYLNLVQIPIYKIMILNSSEITKEIKKTELKRNNKISNEITLDFDKYSFNLHYSRFSIYIIILDFIEEFLGLETLLSLDKQIHDTSTYESIKKISNDISKKIYNYLKQLLPSSYLQNLSKIISDEIIKEKKSEIQNIVAEDVSDQFILKFWINLRYIKKDFLIKTYSTVADFCVIYRRSIELSRSNHTVIIDQINDKDPWDNLSQEHVDNLMDQLADNSVEEIFYSIDYIQKSQANKINLLKKNQINELKIFSKYQKTALNLPLTILRICIFGEIQNKIIESERRKNLDIQKELDLLDENLKFKDQYNIYKNLIVNIDFLKGILFYKLWVFGRIEALQFIRQFLSKSELTLFNIFLKENKHYIENPNMSNDVNKKIFKLIEEFLILGKDKNFNSFKENLQIFKKQSKTFRRSGVDFNDLNDKNIFILSSLYTAISKIEEFLNEFLLTLNPKLKKLEYEFSQDKKVFFKNFFYLYSKKEKKYETK